jgi:hypothetical protein
VSTRTLAVRLWLRVCGAEPARPEAEALARYAIDTVTEVAARRLRGSAGVREIGVSRTTDGNWSRGYKTYRNGVVVGFVPPLERLAVREISPRFLSQDERIEIADLRHAGLSIRQIARRL